MNAAQSIPESAHAVMNRAQVERWRAEAEEMLEDAVASQRFKFAEATENMAFYRGLQFGQATRLGFYAEDSADGEEREVRNYIAPTVGSLAAARLRAMPNLKVTANSSDIGSITKARFQERLLRSFRYNGVHDIEEFYKAEIKRAVHGAVWLKTYWDPNRGKATRQPRYAQGPNGELIPQVDAFGVQKWWHAFEGEIVTEHYDIIDVLPDPHATRPSEVRHIFHRKLVPLDRALDRFSYDAFGRKLSVKDFDQNQGYFEVFERDAVENDAKHFESSLGGTKPARAQANQLARIVEFWVKPTNEFPRGGLLVYSGNTVLAASPLPYEWPWDLLIGRNVLPASLYSDGDVVHLKDPQRAINLVASKMKEYVANCASPTMLAPNNSKVSPGDFSDIAGDVVMFDPMGGRPEWMNVPNMPAEVASTELRLREQMGDISAVSDVARGDVPPQVETGRALAYLYEFQNGVHEPDVALQHNALRSVAQKQLKLAHDFYAEDRLIALTGDNADWEAYHFKRADMGPVGTVVIETEDQKPNSRAIRRAEALEDYAAGAYEDTPAAKRYREVVNMPHFGSEEIDIERQHHARALEEQTGILHGVPPTLLEQDDDEFHLEKHQAFVLSKEFRNLPIEWQSAFLQHIAEHEMRFIESLQAQQAMGGLQAQPNTGSQPKQPGIPSPLNGGQGDMENLAPGGAPGSVEEVAQDVQMPS